MYHGAEAAGDTQAYSTNICIQRIHIFPIKEAEVSKQTKFEPCGPTRILPQQQTPLPVSHHLSATQNNSRILSRL
jgi:hypothetical protein